MWHAFGPCAAEPIAEAGADGFHLTVDVLTNIFDATGALTSTINGRAHHHPANGT